VDRWSDFWGNDFHANLYDCNLLYKWVLLPQVGSATCNLPFTGCCFVDDGAASLATRAGRYLLQISTTPHDPESDAGGSLSSWQGHPSR
jgi:hypothetical protein